MEKNGELEEAETINQDQDLQEEKTIEQIDTLAKLGHVESGNSEEEFNIEDEECSLVEEKTINVDVSTPLSSKDSSVDKDVKIQPAPSRSGSSDRSVSKPTVEVKVKEVKQSTVTTVANSSSTPAGLGPGAPLREPVQRSAAVATQPSRANGTVHQSMRKMGNQKKRKREERATIHPRNKYSGNPPDFDLLASLYPSFKPYVFYSADGHPRIDWTDFNATRELTRVLLLHDHSLNWWIPDGQLCPTVPNRSNYIHWIEDLLSSKIIPNAGDNGDGVKGFDIGTGANCIYPLIGASLLGWCFVGSDVTDVALEWANKNVNSNPHISRLIEIRKVEDSLIEVSLGQSQTYQGPPILDGVVKDGEKFDFCMCNPPFFEMMEEAGLNPNTSCGGTQMEMVCPGGEQAFISRMIEDSVKLQHTFRWYTSMVGRKLNLKILTSKLWKAGASVVKTTEFVQGHTCRWGLAWSFLSPSKKIISHVDEKRDLSFTLQGIQRQYSAFHVLQAVELFFRSTGASCKLNVVSFHVDITASELSNEMLKITASDQYDEEKPGRSSSLSIPDSELNFRISVFQQIPGTLLVEGSLQHKDSPLRGAFPPIFKQLEDNLRTKFCNHSR